MDARLNASMIFSGMGEVDPLQGNAAKLFASLYALFPASSYWLQRAFCSRRLFIVFSIAFIFKRIAEEE